MNASPDERVQRGGATLAERYGYSPEALSRADERAADILRMLASKLDAQSAADGDYFIGNGFTAADLYWACFSQWIAPLDESVNRMPGLIRDLYTVERAEVGDAIVPILLSHRDRVYRGHLSLQLDF